MNSVLNRQEIDAGFTLLAWRNLSVAAEPGLQVHVRSGTLRVREGAAGSPQVLAAGGKFIARRDGLLELKARTHAELHIEWPEHGLERLSPGLEPLTWPAESARGAMEPIARAARP